MPKGNMRYRESRMKQTRYLSAAVSLNILIFTCSFTQTAGAVNNSFHYVAGTLPPDAFLALRTEPSSTRGEQILEMPNGTMLEIIERRPDNWWFVRVVETGQTGWARSQAGHRRWIRCCVQENVQSSPLGKNSSATAFPRVECIVADPTPTPLNVRVAPNGRVTRTLDNGQEVHVIDRTIDGRLKQWAYVSEPKTNKPIGWVYGGYIVCKGEAANAAPESGLPKGRGEEQEEQKEARRPGVRGMKLQSVRTTLLKSTNGLATWTLKSRS